MTQSDIDTTTPKYLRNKYALVGVGETTYRRGSQESTRNLATWAVNNALDDAGLEAADIDGMLSYSGNDSTMSPFVAGDLGIRLNFYMDVHGGADRRRPGARAGVRLAERRPDVRADVPAPHVRLRHHLRTGRARQGGAQ